MSNHPTFWPAGFWPASFWPTGFWEPLEVSVPGPYCVEALDIFTPGAIAATYTPGIQERQTFQPGIENAEVCK